jgi:hypothetical protein
MKSGVAFSRWSAMFYSLGLALSFGFLLFFSGLASGQALSGIVGTVTDSSGAVVIGADVTAINNATGVTSHAVTSAVGTYLITDLIPGEYTISVHKSGFSMTSIQGATVETGGKKSTVNVVLKPGAIAETVSVGASQISLETDSAEIGTTVEHDLIEESPIEFGGSAAGSGSTPRGRRIDAFLTLTPGVSGSSGFYRINGGQDFSNAVAFNGVPVTFSENPGDTEYLNPPFEMVNEARVVSATSGSQSGLGQGTASYGFRSGTNTLHGSAFEIMRNSSLDARGAYPEGFVPPPGPIPTPADHENNFGFSLGGPVVIPHLYNGKNKTFFQFDIEWYNFKQACVDCLGTVPTAKMLTGDFSQNFITCTPGTGGPGTGQSVCPTNGQQTVPIYVPLAWATNPASIPAGCEIPGYGSPAAAAGQPFPNNQIPSTCFSQLSQSILAQLPHADVVGPNPNVNNILTEIPSYPAKNNKWGFSIDHSLTEKQKIHGSVWRSPFSVLWANSYYLAANSPLSSVAYQRTLGAGLVLNYSNAISNRLVVTAGLLGAENFNDWSAVPAAINGGLDSLAQAPQGFPGIGFNGPNAINSFGLNAAAFQPRHNKGLTFINNWIYTSGRHTMTFGMEFRHTTQHQSGENCACPGNFGFSSATTSNNDQNTTDEYNYNNTGSSTASFLLGDVNGASRSITEESKLRNFDYAPYLQDDIKVTPKLTANLGLRWDIAVPFTNATLNPYSQVNFFQANIPNPGAISTATGQTLNGAYSALGTCSYCVGYNRADIHWKHFGPSIGLAYQLNQKTVIRSGYSLSFLPGGAYNYGDTGVPSYLIGLRGGFVSAATYGNAGWPGPGLGTWDSNPLFPLPVPAPNSFSPTICNGVSSNQCTEMFSKDPGAYPYSQSWSAGIQRELPWKMFFTASYVANRGVHLGSFLEPINQLDPTLLSKVCPGGFTPGYQGGTQCVLGDVWTDNSTGPGQTVNPQTVLRSLGYGLDSANGQNDSLYSPYVNFATDYGTVANGQVSTGATLFQALLPYPQVNGTAYNGFENEGKSRYNSLQTQLQKRLSNGVSILANYTLSRNTSNAEYSRTGTIGVSVLNKYNQGPEYAVTSFDQTHVINITGVYELPIGPGKAFLNQGGMLMKNAIGGWQISGILTYNSGTPFGIGAYGSPLGGGNRANIVTGVKPYLGSYSSTNKCAVGTSGSSCQALPILNPAAFSEPGPWVVGASPRQLSYLRLPWSENENVALAKKFFFGERVHAELRVEFFNLLNRMLAACGPQDTTAGDANFGLAQIGCQSNTRREGQAFFRVQF